MAERDNQEDRQFDQNLRLFTGHLECPEPTLLQEARWKQPPVMKTETDTEPTRIAGGTRFLRRHRLFTLITSAFAAGIALAVFLITPHGATVEAGIILRSLRQTLLDGFEMSLERIGEEGVYVDGRLVVTLRPRNGAERSLGERLEPSELEVASLYAEARLQGDPADESKAGLDLQAILALCDTTQWAYLKTSGLPNWPLEDKPLAWAIVGVTSGGLLIDLGNSPFLEELRAADRHVAGDSVGMPSARYNSDPAQLIKDFLVGRAGTEQIDHALALIAQTARDIELREVEPGLHVLHVGRFKLDSLAADGAAKLADMTLEVRYRQGQGIESAVLEHLGAYDGALRLTPVKADIDPVLFHKESAIQSRPLTVLDISAVKPLLERIFNHDE